jgi:hypothetical protein
LLQELVVRNDVIFGSGEGSLESSGVSLKELFLAFLLKLVKNYFTSFSMEEEEMVPIIKIVEK